MRGGVGGFRLARHLPELPLTLKLLVEPNGVRDLRLRRVTMGLRRAQQKQQIGRVAALGRQCLQTSQVGNHPGAARARASNTSLKMQPGNAQDNPSKHRTDLLLEYGRVYSSVSQRQFR